MLHWLRYGTPNEPVYLQAIRLIIGLSLIGVVGSVIIFLLGCIATM
jgi:hypothetical protein